MKTDSPGKQPRPAPAPLRKMLRMAHAAARRAHCPYSRFPVGAALLTADGRLFAGCNVENASYGLTICAERAAVAAAVAAGGRSFRAIAVVAGKDRPALPCGACLQVLAEFGNPALAIHCAPLRESGAVVSCRLEDLLPHSFKLQRTDTGHAAMRAPASRPAPKRAKKTSGRTGK